MPYDPSLPADHSPIVAAELRNQFNGLADMVSECATLSQVDQTIAAESAGPCPNVSTAGFTVSDPPTQVEVQEILDAFNDLLTALKRQ